jgi:hypothetical protein
MMPPAAMSSSPAARRVEPRAAGFTLVEILMAISLATLILGAAAVFVFSSFNILSTAQNDPGLDHHRLGVSSFLQYAFTESLPDSAIPNYANITNASSGNTGGNTTGNSTSGNTSGNIGLSLGGATVGSSNTTTSNSGATFAPTDNTISLNTDSSGNSSSSGGNSSSSGGNSSSSSGNDTDGTTQLTPEAPAKTPNVTWAWPPGVDQGEDPYLSFVLPADNPIVVLENAPPQPVRCFLEYKQDEGLEMIWVPPPQPNDEEINAVRRTMLSPVVTGMTYFYYDPNQQSWQNSDTPPKNPLTGNYVLPDYIRLTFNLDGKISNMTVTIPPAQTSVPIY